MFVLVDDNTLDERREEDKHVLKQRMRPTDL
jgi:hypothetical protein